MGIIPTEADGQGCIEGVYMTALVGLIMGSDSDWVTVEPTVEVLAEFGIPFEVGGGVSASYPGENVGVCEGGPG